MRWLLLLSFLLLLSCEEQPSPSNEFSVKQLEEKEEKLPTPKTANRNLSPEGLEEKGEGIENGSVEEARLPSENRKRLNEQIEVLKAELEENPRGTPAEPSGSELFPNARTGAASSGSEPKGSERPENLRKPAGGILKLAEEKATQTLPYGERMYCRLAGELIVSQFDSFAMIDIFEGGEKVGFAFGQASFLVNNRVQIQVTQIAYEGEIYTGQFQAVSLDLGNGLAGRVNRQLGRILLQGILSTLATGLAIQNPGDGISSVVQANLANNSLENLNAAVNAQQFYKTVTVKRQTPFWLISVGLTREVNQGQRPTDEFKDAFQEALQNPNNQRAIEAYRNNLNALGKRN